MDQNMERTVKLDNAQILPGGFRNFSGNPTPFNKAGGERSFCIKLNEEQAEWFRQNSFNVQAKPSPIDPQAITYVLNIKVNFNSSRPPYIVMISGGRGTVLDVGTVNLLDTAEIQSADLAINPHWYEANGRQGYTAYLNSAYITLAENPYAEKYRNLIMNNGGEDMPWPAE